MRKIIRVKSFCLCFLLTFILGYSSVFAKANLLIAPTGDRNKLGLFIAIMALALIAILVLVLKQRQKK